MLNKDLQRWMTDDYFRNTDLTIENSREWTNENLFFPVVGLTIAKNVNEIFEQHIKSKSKTPDELLRVFATEKKEQQNEILFFPVAAEAAAKKSNDVFEQHIKSESKATDELMNDITTKKKEQQNEILFFPVAVEAAAKKTNEVFEQHTPSEMKKADELINNLMKEEKGQPYEKLFLPVAALAVAKDDNEIFKRRQTSEDGSHEEFIFESIVQKESIKNIINELSSQSQRSILSPIVEESSYNEPLLAVEEETDFQESGKGEQFNSSKMKGNLNSISANEGIRSDVSDESSEQAQDEKYIYKSEMNSEVKSETINDEKSKTIIHDEPEKNKKSDEISEDELIRAYEEKKARAAAFAEEYRKSRKEIIEHNGKIRKNHIMWLGLGFICIVVLTISSVLYFFSEKVMEPARGFNPSVLISIDDSVNTHGFVAKVSDSDGFNSMSFVAESKNEESKDISVYGFVNGSKSPDGVVSSDFGKTVFNANSGKLSFSSQDDINHSVDNNVVSPVPTSTDIVIADRIDNKKKAIQKGSGNSMRVKANDTGRTVRTVNEARKTTAVNSAKVNRKVAPMVYVKNTSSPAEYREEYSYRGVDSTQESIFSAIRNERYIEAINMSKINLERNPKDRLSFYSLGIALYATSDFPGATRAFYACLAFDSPNLPGFMVEEFDSAESLENLYVNYPDVESLIRSVEINPRDKSLYLNLFLSNIKSERPRDTSEIFYVIYNHAERHGSNYQNKIKEKGV